MPTPYSTNPIQSTYLTDTRLACRRPRRLAGSSGKSAAMGKHLRQWTGHRLLKILAQMIRSALAWESDLRVGARPASSGRPIQPSHAAAPPGAEGNPDDRPIGPEREATEVKPDAD